MQSITKLIIEGNPLKTIRGDVRQGGCEKLKKYLADRIDPNLVAQGTDKHKLVNKELGNKHYGHSTDPKF